jgi:hypothetical protein
MNNVLDGVVAIFGYLIVFVIGYLVYKNHQKKTQILAQTAQLSQIAENSYFEAFLDPHNTQKLKDHEVATNKLLAYIKINATQFPSPKEETTQQIFTNQKIAIALYMEYIYAVNSLLTDITNTALFDSFVTISQRLKTHFKKSELSNKTQFAEMHTRNVVTIHQKRYRNALELLKHKPTSADMHTYALRTGREYAESIRAEGVVTLFDETALANDIRAVTANAAQVSAIGDTSSANPTTATASLDERIAKLLKLKAAGLLSDAEFDQKRQALIDEV